MSSRRPSLVEPPNGMLPQPSGPDLSRYEAVDELRMPARTGGASERPTGRSVMSPVTGLRVVDHYSSGQRCCTASTATPSIPAISAHDAPAARAVSTAFISAWLASPRTRRRS